MLDDGVDVGACEAVAPRLTAAARELRDLAAQVLRHAPDAGPSPAADAVAGLQIAAVDALTALAAALDESSLLLRGRRDGG